jgi:hypothetical protein
MHFRAYAFYLPFKCYLRDLGCIKGRNSSERAFGTLKPERSIGFPSAPRRFCGTTRVPSVNHLFGNRALRNSAPGALGREPDECGCRKFMGAPRCSPRCSNYCVFLGMPQLMPLAAASLPPRCRLAAASLPPRCCLAAASLPPRCCLASGALLPPRCRLAAASLPPRCRRLAARLCVLPV